MTRTALPLALAVALAAALPAGAAEEARNDPAPSTTRTPVKVLDASGAATVNAPMLRVALVFDYQLGIVRSKGISQVRKPSGSTGLYCVKVKGMTASQVRNLVPSVTVDYSASSGNALAAHYRSAAQACTGREIGVQTLRGDSGEFQGSDYVGFVMTAP